MTRGNIIVYLGNSKWLFAGEFNGDMYVEGGHGQEIVDFFQSQKKFYEGEIKNYIRDFNRENFQYQEDEYLFEMTLRKSEDWGKHTDYNYVYNNSDELVFFYGKKVEPHTLNVYTYNVFQETYQCENNKEDALEKVASFMEKALDLGLDVSVTIGDNKAKLTKDENGNYKFEKEE